MADKKQDFEIRKVLGGLYVLVVDDSEFDRELAIANLKKIGIRNIQIAENGNVASAKIQNATAVRKPFDLVFLDGRMPTQDGLSLLRWMRKERAHSSQTVIVLTGTNEMDDIRGFIELGVSGFVIKPVSVKVLQEKIFEALQLGRRDAV